ncbi:hypothetical protein MNBD_GAMMA09-3627 [hydrothermal vent metagenome]|uniref:Peptidase C39-like domain-containing protein n=1 Tax=hydrothermal vent metagenome TaxID=652676 RepID=A0A3B0Y538_9ZZZZ
MKIHIDPEESVVSSIGDCYCAPEISREDVFIDLVVQQQQKAHWCWAALASSLADYYQTGDWTQEQIALEIADRDSLLDKKMITITRGNTNVNTTLDKALRVSRCLSHWSPGKPSFERIQFEINLGRPLCMRIEWHAGDAHYAMLNGYDAKNRYVLVKDPLHGDSRQAYKEFPRNYNNCGGVWTETYWTDKLSEE